MDAVTYPDEKVADFVQNNLIPLRVPFDHKPLAAEFNVKWTPTLITLDTEGKEHHRTVGFLPPDELIPSLVLGIGKSHFENGRFDEAIAKFETLLKRHPRSNSAPEAVYLLGVARYKSTHEAKPLREAYDKLAAEYASSEWTQRAYPYRLIS
jgi:tetratricopeptide (TPR) repeat protein